MVYSQYALLRLMAFLNMAYPPPDLDLLMVLNTDTLKEIMRLFGHQSAAESPAISAQNPG